MFLQPVVPVCRREGLNPNVYYRWSKDFLEAGKKRLEGDTVREANSDQVKAKELISVVVSFEIFEVMKKKEPFNKERFVKALKKLPDLPI